MLRATQLIGRLSIRFKSPSITRQFSESTATANKGGIEKMDDPNVSNHQDAYRKIENLDIMTAAKMLFTDPPKKKKFGIDFHLWQLFVACLPSFAVYLVAKYARRDMKRMDAELEKKKKAEEEKAKEMELNDAKEKEAKADSKILAVKERLDKLEETIKGIAVEKKTQTEKKLPETIANDSEAKTSEGKPSFDASELS